MVQLTINLPDDLAEALERTAAGQDKTVMQYTLDRLRDGVPATANPRPVRGSPKAFLEAMKAAPQVSPEAVDDMEAAIREGRLPLHRGEEF